MEDYLKYKDRPPEDTIAEIQRILREAGIFPVLRWTGENRKGAYSNRITLYPARAGVNGKGTNEIYSTASGYGELMERLQNNVLMYRMRSDGDEGKYGFSDAPDEEYITLEELLEDPDPFTRNLIDTLNGEDELSDGRAMCGLYSSRRDGKDMLTALPFADPCRGRIVRLPIYIVRRFTGTNGMSAGNTMEEAMVQALSELFEREVHFKVLDGEAVPPEIPGDELRGYSFWPLIEDLQSDGRYRVRVFDCSLGRGWPVVCLCVNDLETGRFGIRFGAHPSFPVAVERTLTEAAQGISLRGFASDCRVGSPAEARKNSNRLNIAQGAAGAVYPDTLFSGEPGWEYRPWTAFKGPGNREFLREMIALLRADGYEPLFRDSSFMGFPACFVVIPGFKGLRDMNGSAVRLRRTMCLTAGIWDEFPKITDEDAERLLRLVKYHESLSNSNLYTLLTGFPADTEEFSSDRLGAWLSLRLEDFSSAEHFFGKLYASERDRSERRYLSCMREYAGLRADGRSGEQAQRVIRSLYSGETAERACRDTEDLSRLPEGQFPRVNCPDCEGCIYRDGRCGYPEEEELYIKAAKAMKKENVSQEKLLELLRGLMAE